LAQQFDALKNKIAAILAFKPTKPRDAFFTQETLRFHSIAGSIEQNFLNTKVSIDERILTHILVRSLIENYFKLLYIFDDPTQSQARFDECVNGFKREYSKMYNDPFLPHKNQLEPPDPAWSSLKKPMDLNSMLAALNINGTYIYFVYRVSSFDTHGNSLEALFDASFSKKPCNFPVLDLGRVIELMATDYLRIWNNGTLPP
jgi:hypothetical protein